MRGFDIREWKALDWAGFASLIALVLIPTINAGMKDYPEFAARMPAFVSWPYLPVPLMLFLIGVIALRSMERATPQQAQRSLLPPQEKPKKTKGPVGVRPSMVGPFRISDEPRFSDFKLLPISYEIELNAPLPYVQAHFYAISFLSQEVAITQVKLSLRLNNFPVLEFIPLVQDDFLLDPKSTPIVTCRRNLTDSELRVIPKKSLRESASFELYAKAADSDTTYSYGPVSSMVINGSVNSPPPPEEPRPSKRV